MRKAVRGKEEPPSRENLRGVDVGTTLSESDEKADSKRERNDSHNGAAYIKNEGGKAHQVQNNKHKHNQRVKCEYSIILKNKGQPLTLI